MSDGSGVLGGWFPRGGVAAELRRALFIALPISAVLAVLGGILFETWAMLDQVSKATRVPALAILAVCALLSALPVCICIVQNVIRNRQLKRLESLQDFPVARTAYYQAAVTAVNRVKTVGVDSDYLAPIVVYAAVLMLGFSIISLGICMGDLMAMRSVFLGGWNAAVMDAPSLQHYQTQTFAVASTAFIGSYVYTISRLLDRVNNNDLYPISLYYYSARAIIAVFAAAVLRHVFNLLSLTDTSLLILVGFAVGMAPDLFVVTLSRRAYQLAKVWGARDEPLLETRPTSLPLLMIDDLSRDKIDRLSELGIDSAQVLARQNPFLLWPRLPYDLTLIVDWIGQAHLYALLRDERITDLRRVLVHNTFDLLLRLKEPAATPAFCQALGIAQTEVPGLIQQIEADPSFARLQQVNAALGQV